MKIYLKAFILSAITVSLFLTISFVAFGADKRTIPCDTGFKGFLNKILPKQTEFQCRDIIGELRIEIENLKNRLQTSQSLGATITQTELSNTINTFRTNTNTNLNNLNAQLTDSTSSDPGHTHTASAVSGTISIAKGGTATTTFDKGLVTASGTDAFDSLSANGDGSVPIASGTGWVANTLTAGSNVTITNTPGGISLSVPGASSFQFVTSTILTTNQTIITATSTVARRFYKVYLYAGTLSPASGIYMRLGDSGDTNVSSTFVGNKNFNSATFGGSEDTTGPGGNTLRVMVAGSASSTIMADISNFNGASKNYFSWGISDSNPAGYPTSTQYFGLYNRKSQVNNIHFILDGASTFASGSALYVYGSAD